MMASRTVTAACALLLAAAFVPGGGAMDPMELPCGKTMRVATHVFPPFVNIDRTKCDGQRCPKAAFGCHSDLPVGCSKGGITYRFVENDLKAELKKQCKALGKSEVIAFEWFVPPSDLSSASSPVSMVCNGAYNSSGLALQNGLCASGTPGHAHEYKEVGKGGNSSCDAVKGTCAGPDLAAGSIQIRIDRLSLLHFSTAYLTVSQQVVVRAPSNSQFFADLPKNMGLIFAPFENMLWAYIMAEIGVMTLILLFVDGAVNDDIAEGWESIPDAFYWSFTTILGGADKAPVSIGGKVVFVAHAIFALIIAATYTGAVAAFLTTSAGLESVDGYDALTGGKFPVAIRGPYWDSSAAEPIYKGVWSGGTGTNQTAASSQFLQMQALMESDSSASFNIMTYQRMETRTPTNDPWEYKKDTSPCKDKDNVLGVFDAVLCGKDSDRATPMAMVHDSYSVIAELNRRKQIDGSCKLISVGTQVNPAGLGLAFPASEVGSNLAIPFSKAILTLTQRDAMTQIIRNESLHKDSCANAPGNELQLSLIEMAGLFVMTAAGIVLGCIVGIVERFFYFRAQASEAVEGDGDQGSKAGNEDEEKEEEVQAVAAEEENIQEEYECITGLLGELDEQMGRIEELSSKLTELREKAQDMQVAEGDAGNNGPGTNPNRAISPTLSGGPVEDVWKTLMPKST